MQCGPCRKKHIDRDGGEEGLCFQHRRQRCVICDQRSFGMETCVDCHLKIERTRDYGFRNFRIPESNQSDYRAIMGEENLRQARLQAYAAVDSLFRILSVTLQYVAHPPAENVIPDDQMEFTFTHVA